MHRMDGHTLRVLEHISHIAGTVRFAEWGVKFNPNNIYLVCSLC